MRIAIHGLAARHPAAASLSAPALKPLTLTIAPGEQVAVIGPSGAGKTTLLHALACALKPTYPGSKSESIFLNPTAGGRIGDPDLVTPNPVTRTYVKGIDY